MTVTPGYPSPSHTCPSALLAGPILSPEKPHLGADWSSSSRWPLAINSAVLIVVGQHDFHSGVPLAELHLPLPLFTSSSIGHRAAPATEQTPAAAAGPDFRPIPRVLAAGKPSSESPSISSLVPPRRVFRAPERRLAGRSEPSTAMTRSSSSSYV